MHGDGLSRDGFYLSRSANALEIQETGRRRRKDAQTTLLKMDGRPAAAGSTLRAVKMEVRAEGSCRLSPLIASLEAGWLGLSNADAAAGSAASGNDACYNKIHQQAY